MAGSHRSEGVSAALAAFVSAVLSVALTIAGTLVGLRSQATQGELFLVLTWVLIATSIASGAVALWILADSIRKNVRELAHLRNLEDYMPQLVRFRRRHDTFVVRPDGDALLSITCDVESPTSAFVPWISFAMTAEVVPGAPEWESIQVRRVCVDGVDADPAVSFVKLHRKVPVDGSGANDRVVEVGAVRIPVSLDSGRTRCSFDVEVALRGAFTYIDREEKCYAEVPHVTDELRVVIKGENGLRISCSPFAEHRVKATLLSTEMPDLVESQVQSAHCQMSDEVRWVTTNAKVGYSYAIAVRGQS
ncbi:hypothetical protein [Streptomyces sp. CoH27]|uniref:hypothetical protein n=1 Tax=Streptomyces sp. CoH27 TaxID=2875763 RepID=UPI001CD2332B|nr:hypothetical protein [Streptomyces sp. CoH27]